MKIYKLAFLAIAALLCMPIAYAQNTTSPYSKFGYGLINDNASSTQRAMGGIGYGMNNGRQINVMNPASYAAIDSMTFLLDMGVDLTCISSEENGKTINSNGGGVDYVTLQFPIGKNMGGSFGLIPYSSVGYSFSSEVDGGQEYRDGSGGINQIYLGYAIRPFKNFSLGLNLSYNFGTVLNDVYAYANTGSITLFQRTMEIRTWNLQLGAQYTKEIDRKNRATIGVVYTPKKSLHGHAWGGYYDSTSDSEMEKIGYTSLKGNYETPHTFGVGLNYVFNNKLMVETDFTYQDWANAKYTPIEGFDSGDLKFDNRWKAAAGLQFIPEARGSYFKRVNYRIGGYYCHDYINIRDNNVREYGLGMGFGFPTPSTKTIVNIGFEYKHRTSSPVNFITENYFNFTLGVTFNEMWFWKNKIR